MNDPRLWAITAYFNPCRYRTRLENFRAFRARLGAPLVAVELAYGDDFDLEPGDADVLIRLRGQDVLWQKERLLNLAIASVPQDCEAVAWLDCDILFADPDWVAHALHVLEGAPVIQPFSRVCDLPRGWLPGQAWPSEPEAGRVSLARAMQMGALPLEIFRTRGASMKLGYSPGHAWAARRDLLERHGLYDALILGGGDKVVASAAFGHCRAVVDAYELNAKQARHYLDWAEPFCDAVRGRVGVSDGTIFHLWHGDLSKRGYGDRYRGFDRFDFDPHIDLRLAGSGCWRWGTDKAGLHDHVRDYFLSREEDGAEALPLPASPAA